MTRENRQLDTDEPVEVHQDYMKNKIPIISEECIEEYTPIP